MSKTIRLPKSSHGVVGIVWLWRVVSAVSPMKSGGFSSWFDDSYVKASAESSKTKEPAPVKIEKSQTFKLWTTGQSRN